MRVIVYEDPGWQQFLPLVYMRAVFQLISGMGDLLSIVARTVQKGTPLDVWCRPGIAHIVAEQTGLPANKPLGGRALLLNGRCAWRRIPEVQRPLPWVGTIDANGREMVVCIAADDSLIHELTPDNLLDEVRTRATLADLPRVDLSDTVEMFKYPWHLINRNADAIEQDWRAFPERPGIEGTVDRGSYLLNEADIAIGKGSRIKPCVVVDAEAGPVWIGESVTIHPHAYVEGPAYIGDGTVLQPGAVVREGTHIGHTCKVGGEIEAGILQGFSNKQHDGFLGHAYIGSWVNIAADCINSDLKNTYGNVRVPLNGYDIDTGEMFVGMLVGDHSKAGINVSFPTGAVIGFCSSIFAPQSPKFVPSFTWITNQSVKRYDAERGLRLARRVMARRKQKMSPAEERAFLSVIRQAAAIERQYLREMSPGE